MSSSLLQDDPSTSAPRSRSRCSARSAIVHCSAIRQRDKAMVARAGRRGERFSRRMVTEVGIFHRPVPLSTRRRSAFQRRLEEKKRAAAVFRYRSRAGSSRLCASRRLPPPSAAAAPRRRRRQDARSWSARLEGTGAVEPFSEYFGQADKAVDPRHHRRGQLRYHDDWQEVRRGAAHAFGKVFTASRSRRLLGRIADTAEAVALGHALVDLGRSAHRNDRRRAPSQPGRDELIDQGRVAVRRLPRADFRL